MLSGWLIIEPILGRAFSFGASSLADVLHSSELAREEVAETRDLALEQVVLAREEDRRT